MQFITPKQLRVLRTVADDCPYENGWTPTNIGLANGKEYAHASSWANGAIKALTRDDLLCYVGDSDRRLIVTIPGRRTLDCFSD